MGLKILLDPGHGGSDPGAVFRELREKTIVLSIAKESARLLTRFGHVAILTRTMDQSVTLEERVIMANAWQADLFISIHCNADPDNDAPGMPEAKGNEIWIYPRSQRALKLAECLQRAALVYFPQHRRRGIKETTGLYVLRETKMPAVLIETAFIDTNESTRLSEIKIQCRIAQAIATAVREYAGSSNPLPQARLH